MFGKKYSAEDVDILNYFYYQLPNTQKWFRGPQPNWSRGRPIAFLGAASCFGRFVPRPYSALIGERLGVPVLNLGYGGARAPFYYRDPGLMEHINRAAVVVIEIFSARGTGTTLIESRNDGSAFLRWSGSGAEFAFADSFFHQAWHSKRQEMPSLIADIRQRYIEQMHSLLWRIGRPVVLLWLSQRRPEERADYEDPAAYGFSFPHFVDRPTLNAIGQQRVNLVEVVSQIGLPQSLPARRPAPAPQMRRIRFNRYYPSPEMHRLAADNLVPVLEPMVKAL